MDLLEAWKRLRRHLELENARWTQHDSGRQERERDMKQVDEAAAEIERWQKEAIGFRQAAAAAGAENQRLRAALQNIVEGDWYWGVPWNPETGHNTKCKGKWAKYAEHCLNQQQRKES